MRVLVRDVTDVLADASVTCDTVAAAFGERDRIDDLHVLEALC